LRAWTGPMWLRLGTDGSTCECGNELSGSIKCGEFLAENRLASQDGLSSMD
jgi:hypothetical protein